MGTRRCSTSSSRARCTRASQSAASSAPRSTSPCKSERRPRSAHAGARYLGGSPPSRESRRNPPILCCLDYIESTETDGHNTRGIGWGRNERQYICIWLIREIGPHDSHTHTHNVNDNQNTTTHTQHAHARLIL